MLSFFIHYVGHLHSVFFYCFLFRYRLVSLCVRNSELTKEKILKKAGVLFNTIGYKATSLSTITDATGLTKGAIYRHFASKEALEKETLFYLSSVMFNNLREVIKEQNNAGDKLRAIVRYFESYVTNPPLKGGCPLLNAAIEADDTNPSLRKQALQILSVLQDSLLHILKNGIERKQIKPGIDKEYYATVIIASLEGAIMMSKLKRSNEDIKRIVKHLEKQIEKVEI